MFHTLDTNLFKSIAAGWMSAVSLVTSGTIGTPQAMTTMYFSIIDPVTRRVGIMLDTESAMASTISTTRYFAVHLLDVRHTELAQRYTNPEAPTMYPFVGWTTAHTGAPILMDAVAWFDCTLSHQFEMDSKVLMIGTAQAGSLNSMGVPLLYQSRQWREAWPEWSQQWASTWMAWSDYWMRFWMR